jgi:hypothetical protein
MDLTPDQARAVLAALSEEDRVELERQRQEFNDTKADGVFVERFSLVGYLSFYHRWHGGTPLWWKMQQALERHRLATEDAELPGAAGETALETELAAKKEPPEGPLDLPPISDTPQATKPATAPPGEPQKAEKPLTLKEQVDAFAAEHPDWGRRKLWTEWRKDKTRPPASMKLFPMKEGRGRKPK